MKIGCGAGNVSIELAKKGYDVFGVDFSESAVSWAKDLAKVAGVKVNFSCCDATDLPLFFESYFDVVFDGNCLHCLLGEVRPRGLSEVFRVLKSGGLFCVGRLSTDDFSTEYPDDFDASTGVLYRQDTPYRYITTPESLIYEITQAGFTVDDVFVRKGGHFGHTNIFARKSTRCAK